jgi:hypothetical protein
MRYDPSKPTAVFLGPSLERSVAEGILPANYYPPVRMGDVYGLLATGVRTLLIIDGVFHQDTPVWQREILAALRCGITVVGASSMGALRAAETAAWGTIGRGTIFEWYRNGVIDGDDEVALLHAREAAGYTHYSDPLVNIRHDLGRARERGIVSEEQERALVAEVKSKFFGERSRAALLSGAAAGALGETSRSRLEAFFRDEAVDLKREDALDAVHFCRQLAFAAPAPRPVRTDWPEPSPQELHRRGVLTREGELVPAGDLLQRAASDESWRAPSREQASRRFILRESLRARGLKVPEEEVAARGSAWIEHNVDGTLAAWLRAQGMTRDDLDCELRDRASIEWMLQQGPEAFGLPFGDHRRGVAALRLAAAGTPGGFPTEAALLRDAAEGCHVADWARCQGIQCPDDVCARFVDGWIEERGIEDLDAWLAGVELDRPVFEALWRGRALYHWVVEQGPVYFGFPELALQQALLREAQLGGRMAELAETDGGDRS